MEEKIRKLDLAIREKKKLLTLKAKETEMLKHSNNNPSVRNYTKEDLEKLNNELKRIEEEKVQHEKTMRAKQTQQEIQIKQLQVQLSQLQFQRENQNNAIQTHHMNHMSFGPATSQHFMN